MLTAIIVHTFLASRQGKQINLAARKKETKGATKPFSTRNFFMVGYNISFQLAVALE